MKKKRLFHLTPLHICAEILSLAAVLTACIGLAITWSSLPQQLPSGFGADGTANAWSSKYMLLLYLGVQLLGYLFITVLSGLPRFWNIPVNLTEQNTSAAYRLTYTLLCLIKLILTVSFGYLLFCTASSRKISVILLVLAVLATVGVMVYYFVQNFRLSLAGAKQLLREELEAEEK